METIESIDIKKPAVFNLSSVESKGDSIKVSWIDQGNEYSRTSKTAAHPDFRSCMSRLVSILTEYYDKGSGSDDHTSFKKVAVNKYSDDKGRSAQVVGVYSHPLGKQNTTLTTAKIQTHSDAYGFETELNQCIEEIASEACAYIFDDKNSQVKMEFEPAKEEAEEAVEA